MQTSSETFWANQGQKSPNRDEASNKMAAQMYNLRTYGQLIKKKILMKPASSNLHNKDMIIHAGSIRPK